MKSKVRTIEISLGEITGLMIGTLFCAFLSSTQCINLLIKLIRPIKEWQTLIAGVLGVTAASASVCMLNLQIQLQRKIYQRDITRRLTASRIIAPEIVRELQRYGRECWVMVLTLLEEADEPMAVWAGEAIPEPDLNDVPKLPTIDERLFSGLKDWITYEDPRNAAKLARAISDYQIFHSGMPTHKHPSLYKPSLKITAVKITTFLLVIEDCWEMARRDLAPYDRLSNNALNLVDALFGSAISDISPNFVYKTTIHDELKENIRRELLTGASP